MVRSFIAVFALCSLVIFPVVGLARPAAVLPISRTSSVVDSVVTVTSPELPSPMLGKRRIALLSVGLEADIEKSNLVEPGIVHPRAIRIFVLVELRDWVAVFANARHGESGESYAGATLRPLTLFGVDPRVAVLDLGIGVGMAGGIVMPGWIFRFETPDALFFTRGHRHYVTGWDEDMLLRFKVFPREEWFLEGWIGFSARVAGEEQLYDSLEAVPFAAVRFPRLIQGSVELDCLVSIGWPLRRREHRIDPKVRPVIEFEITW